MPVLFPRAGEPTLADDLFRQPTAEYRGAPFWSWNCRLDAARLCAQIDLLAAMGMGGFFMHSRTGLRTPYLGGEFMDCVRACVAHARSRGLKAWLYDEDRWPSGFAGGLVTRAPEHRLKHLLWTPWSYAERPAAVVGGRSQGARTNQGVLLARHGVRLDRDGRLAAYRRLADGEPAAPGERTWYAYLEASPPSDWYNHQTYVDTLSRPAVERFLAETHERYAAAVGGDFGATVPGIFTDEPLFTAKECLGRADELRDLLLPWTTDLADSYRAAWGEDPLDRLPELFWELPEGSVSATRWRFHDHHTERFAAGFADTVGAWCAQHGIALTGHLMAEENLGAQTAQVGEAMRSYRGFQLPGIDMLCDWVELLTAKQAQSAARQFGRPGIASELYGVTNWDFSFAGHKRQGDWQAALGVVLRVHHLAWASMAGEAKRDYPAAIGWQSPWFREYPLVEDHFARLNTVLTRGRPRCRVAIVHPIESFWLCWGPLAHTAGERAEREAVLADLLGTLLHGLIDADLIAESLLPGLHVADAAAAPLAVGAMRYDVVILPGLRTLRTSTLALLEAFRAAGGTVLIVGAAPELVDALPDARAARFAARCTHVGAGGAALLPALAPWREVAVSDARGRAVPELLHQLRDDGDERVLFLCDQRRADGTATPWEERAGALALRLAGTWAAVELDTADGSQRARAARHDAGATVLDIDLPPGGHLLLRLRPVTAATPTPTVRTVAAPVWREVARLAGPVPVTLHEPNVLLLDQAQFRLDDGPWEARDEVLRIDNRLRARIGLPLKGARIAQPWAEPDEPARHRVTLRFAIDCAVAVAGARLALEDRADAVITLDGWRLDAAADGWWVDECLGTVPLPDLAAGAHTLEIAWPLARTSALEWCYLLGDFGVEARGRDARVVAPVRSLGWGDWTRQGLPFYAGNLTYHARLEGDGTPLALSLPHLGGALAKVSLAGVDRGAIAWAPWRADLGMPATGTHALDLTVFNNRINAFGALHNCESRWRWWGPQSWRTEGAQWADEWQLRPLGALVAPALLRRGFPQH